VLIIAHRILIGAAIAFGLFFTVWEFLAYRQTGLLRNLAIALASAVITVGLGYYLRNLQRFVG
jgi:hypothetical protein